MTIQEKIIELTAANPEIFEGGEAKTKTKAAAKKSSGETKAAGLIRKGVSVADNPTSIVAQGIKFLPHAALAALALALVPMIFDELTRPGGILDLRWRRIISNEVSAYLSRQTQKDTQFGVRQVIIQSKIGFTATNGKNNYNTLRGIREGGLNKELFDRIGMIDHTKGVFDFG